MKVFKTNFQDLPIIKSKSFKDNRGILRLTFDDRILKKFPFEYSTISRKMCLEDFTYKQNLNKQNLLQF